MDEGTDIRLYSIKRFSERGIERLITSMASRFGLKEWQITGITKGYEPFDKKKVKPYAKLMHEIGGAMDFRGFWLCLEQERFRTDKVLEAVYLNVPVSTNLDVSEAVDPGCEHRKNEGHTVLKKNRRFLDALTAVLTTIGEKLIFGAGDDFAYIHEYEGCYPQCVTHNHWIQFYGAPLLNDEITNLLLEAPVYKAEKVKDGVLITNTPIARSYLPDAHEAAGQPQEIQDLMQYENQWRIIESYFKQHGLHEKLRKKAEEFDKQAKEQKGETE